MSKVNKQWVWVGIVVLASVLISAALFLTGKSSKSESAEEGHAHAQEEAGSEKHAGEKQEEGEHDEEKHGEEETHAQAPVLSMTAPQMVEYGVKTAAVELGQVQQLSSYPAKLVVNTDQQAHVTASFMARVEQVKVSSGQHVNKGQILATLFVPELVDQQANLRIAQEALTLAKQDYQREKQLFDQGVSARQDYQRALNAYRQAQIQVQAATQRLSAYGVAANSQGRYVLKAPLSGVISQKDIVVGEQVEMGKQLFVIDQLDQLWVEFVLPSTAKLNLEPEQQIQFKSLQTQRVFTAKIQSLTPEADAQTGRLQVRASVVTADKELRPNLMVNVLLQGQQESKPVLRVAKQAVQQVEGKTVVFVAKPEKDKISFVATPVQLGRYSSDGQWIEVKTGLTAQHSYVNQGSFLLKSEMEKGDAAHGH